MRIRQPLLPLAALCCFAVTACSSHAIPQSSSIIPDAASPIAQTVEASNTPSDVKTVYVSDDAQGFVNYYNDGGKQLAGTITNSIEDVFSLAVDSASNLYVGVNTIQVFPGNNGRVRAYTGGIVVPAAGYSYSSYGYSALGVARVFGNELAIVVPVTSSGAIVNSAMAIYPKLFTQPSDVLTPPSKIIESPTGWCVVGETADARGDIYTVLSQSCELANYQLREYAPGSSTGRQIPMPPDIAHTFGGIALDAQGNLLLCDKVHVRVDIFPPGKLTPSRSIEKGLKGCGAMAFDRDERTLYVVDQPVVQQSPGYPGVVSVFNYKTGQRQFVISAGLNPTSSIVSDVAIDPPAPLGKPYR
jgi:hypothetical protein